MGKKITSATLLVAIACAVSTGPASTSMAGSLMTACSPDIASLCKGVREGRGRISACLFAHGNRISAPCKPELSKVARKVAFKPGAPAGAADEARLKKVCATDIRSHCKGIAPGEGRLLACLYAWSNRVSSPCEAEAKAMISSMR